MENKLAQFKLSLIAIITSCLVLGVMSCGIRANKLEIPDADRDERLSKFINSATEPSGLKPLREVYLSGDDFEVRVWRGFGLSELEGVPLKRSSGKWSADHLKANDCCLITRSSIRTLPPPKSGWDNLWSSLEGAGIHILPDSSRAGCGEPSIDGMSYVVEINQNGTYRTYKYQTSYDKCEQIQQMKQIGRILANEFYDGKEECVEARWLPCVAKYGVQNDL